MFVQRSPATATQQTELAIHVLDRWVDLSPHVTLCVPDLNCVVVLSIGEHSTHFDQKVITNRGKARVCGRVLTRWDQGDFICFWVEDLTFLEDFLIICHASNYVDQLFVVDNTMTGSWHNKLSNFKKRSFLMAILIDDLTLPEGIDNSASKDINRPFLSGHCAMKRWNREIDIQRNNIPLNRFRLLNLIDIDLM